GEACALDAEPTGEAAPGQVRGARHADVGVGGDQILPGLPAVGPLLEQRRWQCSRNSRERKLIDAVPTCDRVRVTRKPLQRFALVASAGVARFDVVCAFAAGADVCADAVGAGCTGAATWGAAGCCASTGLTGAPAFTFPAPSATTISPGCIPFCTIQSFPDR